MSEENSGSPETITTLSSGGGNSGGGKMPIILAMVNLLVTVAMVVLLALSLKKDKDHPAVEDISVQSDHAEHEAKEKGGEEGSEHGGKGEGAGAKSIFTKTAEKMVPLDLFTVNLSTPGITTPKFVRVNISLEIPNDDTESEIKLKDPQIRNTIIDLFNSKKPGDLATVDGREFLKEEIRTAINSFLVSGKIKGVYFTNFSLSG